MAKYGISFQEYMHEDLMEEVEQRCNPEIKRPFGFFPIKAINNIPYIEYPGFTKEQNLFAMNMAKEVLLVSRKENKYREVAITYNLSNPEEFVVVKGDENSVSFLDDQKTSDLINSSSPLMIVSLHNHPNNSEVSLRDIMIFCATPQIKLMSIVNARGEVSFLEKEKDIALATIAKSIIERQNRDLLIQRDVRQPQQTIIDILSDTALLRTKKEIMGALSELGVRYHDWVGQREREQTLPDELPEIKTTPLLDTDTKKLHSNKIRGAFSLLCGLPFTGKTQFGENLAKQQNTELISIAMLKKKLGRETAYTVADVKICSAIAEGQNVILDAPNLGVEVREHFLEIARHSGSTKNTLIFVNAPSNVIAQRARETRFPNDVLEEMRIKLLDNHPSYNHKNWDEYKEVEVKDYILNKEDVVINDDDERGLW